MATKDAWRSDRQYEDHTLAEVAVGAEHWTLKTTEGWMLQTPAVSGAAWTPAAGDTVRYFGRGIGSPVRGVVVFRAGHESLVSRYRTEDQQDADHAAEVARLDAERQAALDVSVGSRGIRWAALPDEFQARHRRFTVGSSTYRRDYEEYELFCCEQAWAIVSAGVTDARAFSALSYEAQREAVPALSDGHSGNTMGMTLRLAHWWLTKRENVALEHGALTMLVGCEAYGCTHEAQG